MAEKVVGPYCSEVSLLAHLDRKGMRVPLSKVSTEDEKLIIDRITEGIDSGTTTPVSCHRLVTHMEDNMFKHFWMEFGLGLGDNFSDGVQSYKSREVMTELIRLNPYILDYERGLHRRGERSRLSLNYDRNVYKFWLSKKLANKTMDEIQQLVNASCIPIYKTIITGLHTARSVPFLLEAFNSTFAYRGEQQGIREKEREIQGQLVNSTDDYDYYNVDIGTYRVRTFEAIFPLRDVAAEALGRLMPELPSDFSLWLGGKRQKTCESDWELVKTEPTERTTAVGKWRY